MISNKSIRANLFLVLILLLGVFFYTYYIYQNKGSIKIKNPQDPDQSTSLSDSKGGITKFTDVEYRTTSEKNRDYITKGSEAYISKDTPNLILLNNVYSYTILNDGSKLNIKSDKAKYFKNSKNIEYYQNVVITNKESKINAQNANFFSDKNKIILEDVIYKDQKNLLKGDKAELNTITNNLKIYMKNKREKVYGQRKQK